MIYIVDIHHWYFRANRVWFCDKTGFRPTKTGLGLGLGLVSCGLGLASLVLVLIVVLQLWSWSCSFDIIDKQDHYFEQSSIKIYIKNTYYTLHCCLCITSTSASVERMFSHGGLFMRPHRARPPGDRILCELVMRSATSILCKWEQLVLQAKLLTFLVGIYTVNTEQLLTETVHSYALQWKHVQFRCTDNYGLPYSILM